MDTKLPINLNTIFETMGITDVKTQYLLTLNDLEKTQMELESVKFKLARCSVMHRYIRINSKLIGNLINHIEQEFNNADLSMIRVYSDFNGKHIDNFQRNHGYKENG